MSITAIITLILLVGGCGAYERRDCYISGTECIAPENEGEARQGVPGKSGADGQAGKDGTNGERGPAGEGGPMGPSGKDGQDGATGAPGVQGPQGETGANGNDGSSCSVTENMIGGAIISCTDGTSAVVLDGQDGASGRDGLDGKDGKDGMDASLLPFSIVGFVDPCGPQSTYDEILIQLTNGQVVAHFSSGNRQFLTSIGPGTYITTDGTGCIFTIQNDMTITW